jgi:hypothetical protein
MPCIVDTDHHALLNAQVVMIHRHTCIQNSVYNGECRAFRDAHLSAVLSHRSVVDMIDSTSPNDHDRLMETNKALSYNKRGPWEVSVDDSTRAV